MTAAPSSDPHSTAADTPELRAAAEQIAREAGLELVVLFGSVARGEARAEDLDLGVLGAAPIDAVDLTNRLTVLLGRQDVDVVDLRTADPVLLMQVAGEGNALFESTPARFNAFYSLAARRFADTKKFRDAERDWIEEGRVAEERPMTEVDAALVRRKLSRIVRNLEDLESVQNLALAEYVEDRFRQKGTERLLQETIESAVDVNLHLLRAGGVHAPPDYFRSFIEVGRQGIIPLPLAERLAPSTGLRNRLIHEYDEIDDQRVLDALPKAVEEYREYVEAVHSWLKGKGV